MTKPLAWLAEMRETISKTLVPTGSTGSTVDYFNPYNVLETERLGTSRENRLVPTGSAASAAVPTGTSGTSRPKASSPRLVPGNISAFKSLGAPRNHWNHWNQSGLAPWLDPCPGFRLGEWRTVRACALLALSRFRDNLIAAGFTAETLFGVHPVVGRVRMDCCGALINSHEVAEIAPGIVTYANGNRWNAPQPGGPMVAVWDYEWPAHLARNAHAGGEDD